MRVCPFIKEMRLHTPSLVKIWSRTTFSLCIGKLDGSQMVSTLKSHSLSLNLTSSFPITLKIMPEVHEKRPGKSGTVHSITMHVSYIIFIHFALYLEWQSLKYCCSNAKTFPITKRIDWYDSSSHFCIIFLFINIFWHNRQSNRL